MATVTDVSSDCYLHAIDSVSLNVNTLGGNSWQLLGGLLAELHAHECSETHCRTYAGAGMKNAERGSTLECCQEAMLACQAFPLKRHTHFDKGNLVYEGDAPVCMTLATKGHSLPIRTSTQKADLP